MFILHCSIVSLSFWGTRLKFFLLPLLLTTACSQTKPTVTVSPSKVLHTGHVVMRGTGFTPKSDVSSHLRRPDGTEFPVLPILTPGVHEIWVVEDRSKVSSNAARFEVTLDQP